MFSLLTTNLKHFFLTFSILFILAFTVGIYFGVDVDYGDNPLAYKVGKEGPHLFYEGDNISVNYIKGNRESGFVAERKIYALNEKISVSVYFPLEDSSFELSIDPTIESPASIYDDDQPIIAISDVESGFKGFRDFLITHKVIDEQLNWIFGQGHLALVGDFVDRGFSTTQVLWFIYKLEQQAKKSGGKVHFILGNHEIKNLQGNFQKSAYKYYYVASILEKTQLQLFDSNSFIGRWMSSKNTLEIINGYLFVHGGIHPDLSQLNYNLDEINQIVRANYTKAYYPKKDRGDEDLLLSTRNGPSWYRGYFEEDLSDEDISKGLDKFNAKAVVVGHTPQFEVEKLFDGKVFSIDVKHPRDYRGSLPPRFSEGLLIKDGRYFRLLEDGTAQEL